MELTKKFLTDLEINLHRGLKALSAHQGKFMNVLINQAVREFLIKHKEIKIKEEK